MSNFICSECGMTNIDCGYAGYKTSKKIELEKKVHILNEANMKLENELGHFADLSKKVERLQEQLKETQQELQIRINDNSDMYAKLCNALMQLEEANNTLKKIAIAMACDPSDIKVIIPEYCVEQDVLDNCNKYFEKWGVK